ncbi:MAG: 16S rRNA (cytidine(1402)-2'-O)-methyltransferase [Candidatus Aminicenantales bacterium]
MVKFDPRSGILFVVATPIGNLEDITLRALRVLAQSDIIACEDTRITIKLLNKYGLKKRLISYYQAKEASRVPQIMRFLRDGKKVALVSDSGTPGISDPGYRLIQAAIAENIRVVPIPGPSALTAALSAAGLPLTRVLFLGFPTTKRERLRKLISSLSEEEGTIVFYLPGRRLLSFLELIAQLLGNRQVVIARELTKMHEEFIRGRVEEVIRTLEGTQIKGEITLLIEGKKAKSSRFSLF